MPAAHATNTTSIPKKTWQVLLYEVQVQGSTPPAQLVEQFTVEGRVVDVARAEARRTIATRGRAVRSISVSASQASTLIAYALPKGAKSPTGPSRVVPRVAIPTTVVPGRVPASKHVRRPRS